MTIFLAGFILVDTCKPLNAHLTVFAYPQPSRYRRHPNKLDCTNQEIIG